MPNSQLRFGDVSDRGLKCTGVPSLFALSTSLQDVDYGSFADLHVLWESLASLVVLWTDGIFPGNSLLCQAHARGQCANRALPKCVPAGKTSHLTGEQEA